MKMKRWEYLSKFLKSDMEATAHITHHELAVPELPAYAPQALIPELNGLGEKGWELVHIEPVHAGKNGDVLINAQDRNWTHTYFCVFKREA